MTKLILASQNYMKLMKGRPTQKIHTQKLSICL